MGIILEIVGVLVTLMFAAAALKRSGVDVGWLNPFTFFHRLAWRKKMNVPALYCMEHPVDVAATMGMAIVHSTGVMTTEQKQGLISLYSKHLNASVDEANKLWIASSHLLGKRPVEAGEVSDIFARSADKFSSYHVQTLMALMNDALALDRSTNPNQTRLIETIRQYFAKRTPDPKSWGTN
jgi:hypothetical protein